jgi:hypothetical protein
MDVLTHSFNNKVYHCGPTRTGTTIALSIFKEVVKFTNVKIESIHTGHRNITDTSAFGKIITIRNPLSIAASKKHLHYPDYGYGSGSSSLALCTEVWKICNYIKSITDDVDCKFICVVKYEDYFPNNIKQLVFDYLSLINKFTLAQHEERKYITMNSPEYSKLKLKNCLANSENLQQLHKPFVLADSYNVSLIYDDFNKLTEFAEDIAKKYSIENQKKIIKKAELNNFSDTEENRGLHKNHISSTNGTGNFENLSDYEIDRIMLDNFYFFEYFGYVDTLIDLNLLKRNILPVVDSDIWKS